MKASTCPITPKRNRAGDPVPGQLTAPPLGDSPRSYPVRSDVRRATTDMRVDIGNIMNSEMYICTYNQFKEGYLPKCDPKVVTYVMEILQEPAYSPSSKLLVPREDLNLIDDKAAEENESTDSASDDEIGSLEGGNERSVDVDESDEEIEAAMPDLPFAEGQSWDDEDEGDSAEDEDWGYTSDDGDERGRQEEGEGGGGEEEEEDPQLYSHVFYDFSDKPSRKKVVCDDQKSNASTKSKTGGQKANTSSKPKTSNIHENKMFQPLGKIGGAIIEALDKKGVKRNGTHLRMCPHTTLYSNIPGCNQEIDACLTKSESKELDIADALVPCEFKLAYTIVQVFLNRRQIASQANHTMNDDPRRKFMFAITIEDDRVSLWFFSRSHSVKAKSFSFVERPDLLVEVLVSLFCATDEQLGLDPLVHLTPDRRYVYEFPPTDTRPEPIYYRVKETVSENRILRLNCRATRIWQVIQVESPAHTEAIQGSRERVLKDVSLPAEFRTELEIQRELFRDLEEFAKDKEWRRRGVLRQFVEEDLTTLERALEGGFRRFFSCIIEGYAGEVTPPLCPGAWAATTPVFTEPEVIALEHNKIRAAPGTRAPRRPTNQLDELGTIQQGIQHSQFVPRRPCRYIYEDLCTPLDELTTLGEVVDIIQQCLIPLRLMFCVGWVHRDISPGNILALRPSPSAAWQVKLSDLEYAKRFPSNATVSAIPKTGTPCFMASEILSQLLILSTHRPDRLSSRKQGGNRSVIHNFQHDLESLWWILFWAITMRVREKLPRAFCYFRIDTKDPEALAAKRYGLITRFTSLEDDRYVRDCLPTALHNSNFVERLDILRGGFEVEYSKRNAQNEQKEVSTYSWIVGPAFWHFFEGVKDSRDDWSNIRLVTNTELARGQNKSATGKRKHSEISGSTLKATGGASGELSGKESGCSKKKAGGANGTKDSSKAARKDGRMPGPSKRARR